MATEPSALRASVVPIGAIGLKVLCAAEHGLQHIERKFKLKIDQLYAAHPPQVYNLALNYYQSVEEAEEITQDVFLRFYEHGERRHPPTGTLAERAKLALHPQRPPNLHETLVPNASLRREGRPRSHGFAHRCNHRTRAL